MQTLRAPDGSPTSAVAVMTRWRCRTRTGMDRPAVKIVIMIASDRGAARSRCDASLCPERRRPICMCPLSDHCNAPSPSFADNNSNDSSYGSLASERHRRWPARIDPVHLLRSFVERVRPGQSGEGNDDHWRRLYWRQSMCGRKIDS